MGPIESEIQRRLQHGELRPIRELWADGVINYGVVVECPHSVSNEPHFALIPESALDHQSQCPEGHDIFSGWREAELVISAQAPEDFSPPRTIRSWTSDVGKWPI